MKKPNSKLDQWKVKRDRKISISQFRRTNKRRRKRAKKARKRLTHRKYYSLKLERSKFLKSLYKARRFTRSNQEVAFEGSVGIEEIGDIDKFIDNAERIIDFRGKTLRLDVEKCTRMWPSAITLLASLSQWVELTAHPRFKPRISSSKPESDEVRAYLSHSGFYKYVVRTPDEHNTSFDPAISVPLRREDVGGLEDRENEIAEFLKTHSNLTTDQVERFDCVVLTEIFSNITEHGRVHKDEGWWVTAQLHPRHEYISVCLADNGMGIGNSLRTGGQKDYIQQRLSASYSEDGDCIKLAIQENISGSIYSPPPTGFPFKRYKSGARKGHGLERLCNACKDFGVRLSILSHNGYVMLDEKGETLKYGTARSRIFAGTMYHLLIKAKKKEMRNEYHK